MPLIRNTLDCCICLFPADKEKELGFERLFQEIQLAKNPPCGGYVRLRLETFEKPVLYANHQGGYRVCCPNCSANVAREFSRAVEDWRKGDNRKMNCGACRSSFFLEEAIGRPPFAFSRAAIILSDVHQASLGEMWVARCDSLLKEYRVVYRRVG